MQVLKPTTDPQTFYIIPRIYNIGLTFSLRDDSTNTSASYTPTVSIDNDYLKITGVFNLIEGHFYDIIAHNDYNKWNTNNDYWNFSPDTWESTTKKTNKVTLDRIFCTNQTIQQLNNQGYNINKDVYKSDNSFNNDYIVI